ncbi:DegT/DnrJ/EryC1/StrS family aminotransferase [Enterovibrio sp. FF113]|uniref:DegT/DnrJ/EryC1/StrS family aminotransferase n=1 Tax=Enterovibrio sp. FF113 TaxID=3230010 RepID=UPI00352E4BC6
MINKINVVEPYLPDYSKYANYIKEIYERKILTNKGPLVELLTKRLENHLGVKNILLVSNGTIAIEIALRLLECKGEILTTPFSFIATTSVPLWSGCTVKFSDISPKTYNMDVDLLKSSVSSDTCAIMPVHVFGNPCDLDSLELLAKEKNLKLIYDAAHAFDVKFNNRSVLGYGDISTLSFHATKLFHTVEGGAIIISDDKLYEKAKAMVNFGFENGDITMVGTNAKMSEFHAAMGLCVLDDIDKIKLCRKSIYNRYLDKLCGDFQFQKISHDVEYNYSYFPILLKDESTLLKVMKALNDDNIFPRRYFHPSLNTVVSMSFDQCMPVSEDVSQRVLCLPIYPTLTIIEQDKVIDILNRGV